MGLRDDVKRLAHDYVRKGGKQNRKKQAKRMLALAEFSEGLGCQDIGRLGKQHIIKFYKANRSLSDSVIYQHWLAFRHLWILAKKAGEPPKPRLKNEIAP